MIMAATSTAASGALLDHDKPVDGGVPGEKKQGLRHLNGSSKSGKSIGKSGKSIKSSSGDGLANGEDYDWILGDYTAIYHSNVNLINGKPSGKPRTRSGPPASYDRSLQIVRIGDDSSGGYAFGATYQVGNHVRSVFDGVGSFNPSFTNQINFYEDHLEWYNGTDWTTLGSAENSDVSSMRCSQLQNEKAGSHRIVCDVYENENTGDSFHMEVISTILFTDDSMKELE